ncbi:PssD/Cps14F family polysaccharide biosynthesis glycosyltransferase [Lactobacillus sp. LL6]|uniref:PssD/Cps14F family polysaccharide biosynthesis glycosyltransferase n=1 Tax=Lactobacillus sp. LL6 TaxID=2596827 RepID=UPI0011868983|nr:PssD/Cps14F family polysaccharide biosynthesis glycosyltransferase [Lactobacillus sp. LL6]TSO25674.1 polysaccharide biosynthesis protein [Lactobacillus sp. LL6]
MKILFTSSSGGHLEELLQLNSIIIDNESYILTEKNKKNLSKFKKVFLLNQINRKEKSFFMHFLKLFFISSKIYRRIKPDTIISTGALVTVPICIIGKLHHKKIIYIESFARINTPSLTGKIMYKFADEFIVQWEDMLKYFPKAHYWGGIF